ncbi:hypothetical protein FRB90_006116 [Tulasnella sp. 427]|nr:hypothetical protein FRB90_006116 [Tulasnella sp. 427]
MDHAKPTEERLREFNSIILEYGSDTSDPVEVRPYTFKVTQPGHGFEFTSGPLVLRVYAPSTYPDISPTFKVQPLMFESMETSKETPLVGVTNLKLAEIEARLHLIARENKGTMYLRDLIEEVRTFSEDLCGAFSEDSEEDVGIGEPVDADAQYGVSTNVQHWVDRQLVSGLERMDAARAQSYMGDTALQTIINGLPPYLELLHAELVLKPSLVKQFDEAREKLKKKYAEEASRRGASRRMQDVTVDKFTRIDVVYHGTLRRHVAGIVQSGFTISGENNKGGGDIPTYGVGTYTSPDLPYTVSYSDHTIKAPKLLPGQKVIVCAALMGRRYQVRLGGISELRRNPDLLKGYDSHVSPSGDEYVVFNPEHLLPLYVLHLKNPVASSAALKRAWNAPGPIDDPRAMDPSSALYGASADLSLLARRKLLTAQARKHFPYGFGPASGTKFVVEEIAPVDDDEEEWGDYQEDRFEKLLDEIDGVGEFQKMRLK